MPTKRGHHDFLLLFALLLVSLHVVAAATASASAFDANASAHDLLAQFGFPQGLLPGNVAGYTDSDHGHFTVKLSEPCYAQFSELAYYEKTITGRITNGLISSLSGIQVRKFFFWIRIVRVVASSDGTILFDAGHISEKHPASEFQDIHPCMNRVVGAAADA